MRHIPSWNRELPDPRLLGIFDAILREGSLGRAAASLALAQPAVSKALARLRSIFGDPLFVRTARGMEPTPRALELSLRVRETLDSYARLTRDAAPFDAATTDRCFGFFMSDLAIAGHGARLLAELRREAPGARLRCLQIDYSARLAPALETGEVDLAIGPFPGLTQGIRRHPLFTERYASLARPSHAAAALLDDPAGYLRADHVLVSAAGTGHAHAQVERALERLLAPERIVLRVPSFLAAAHVVRDADVVATLPARIARLMADRLGLTVVDPPVRLPVLEFSQYWHDRFHRDPANQWFRRLVRDVLARRDARPGPPRSAGRRRAASG
jgi:DNA-binding transcriptional LysR family regulator